MDHITAYRQRLTEKGYRQTSLWMHESTLAVLDAMGYRSRAAAIAALLLTTGSDRNIPSRLALSGAEHETLAALAPMTLEAISKAMDGPHNQVIGAVVEANLAQMLFDKRRGDAPREAWRLFRQFGEWLKTSGEIQKC
ncbi:TPA: hypothetical protein RUX96_001751 [Aeromonas dhakensis]|nr:hypothetical protein [Aeromonas dhakensis]